MAKIYTVASGKGGAGKSTFCANTASALEKLGKKVLLIDGDAGFRTLDLLLKVDSMVVYDWLDVLENRCKNEKSLLFYSDKIQLLPAPVEIPENFDAEAFKKLVYGYRDGYDFIFIDSPAGAGNLVCSYALLSDGCIELATPDEVSARGAEILGDTLIKRGFNGENLRLVINRYDSKAAKRGRQLSPDNMVDKTYIRLLGVIPEERELTFASLSEKELSPYSEAYEAFCNIAGRLCGKEIPLIL